VQPQPLSSATTAFADADDIHRPSELHTKGATHSSLFPQLVLHVPLGSQMYGEQSTCTPFSPVSVCSPSHALPARHFPDWQFRPAAQSALVAHETLHVDASQAYG